MHDDQRRLAAEVLPRLRAAKSKATLHVWHLGPALPPGLVPTDTDIDAACPPASRPKLTAGGITRDRNPPGWTGPHVPPDGEHLRWPLRFARMGGPCDVAGLMELLNDFATACGPWCLAYGITPATLGLDDRQPRAHWPSVLVELAARWPERVPGLDVQWLAGATEPGEPPVAAVLNDGTPVIDSAGELGEHRRAELARSNGWGATLDDVASSAVAAAELLATWPPPSGCRPASGDLLPPREQRAYGGHWWPLGPLPARVGELLATRGTFDGAQWQAAARAEETAERALAAERPDAALVVNMASDLLRNVVDLLTGHERRHLPCGLNVIEHGRWLRWAVDGLHDWPADEAADLGPLVRGRGALRLIVRLANDLCGWFEAELSLAGGGATSGRRPDFDRLPMDDDRVKAAGEAMRAAVVSKLLVDDASLRVVTASAVALHDQLFAEESAYIKATAAEAERLAAERQKGTKRGRMTQAEAEPLVRRHLRRKPKLTAKDLAGLVGCSVGLVAKTAAWKRRSAIRRAEAARGPKAVALSDKLLRVTAADDGQDADADAELERLVASQTADLADDDRRLGNPRRGRVMKR
ncbi:MAG: hypothetical protein ACFCVE_06570 [Phycisphaerae bacterium]